MYDFNFDTIDTFFCNLQDDSKKRRSKLYELRLDLKNAIDSLRSKFSLMTKDEKLHFSKKILKVSDEIMNWLDDSKVEERDFLESFRQEVLKYMVLPKKLLNKYPEIFKNDYAFQFFIEILHELNVIDNNEKHKRGFQAASNAVFSDKTIKSGLFVRNLYLKEYIKFLNDYFNADIKAQDKLSDPKNYSNDVSYYFRNNFNPK
nr:hypothetical protein [uncultured Psychroserpens sp.]